MFTYSANVVRVIDGDTVDVSVDLGFRLYHTIRLRLAGINAPEVRGPEREEGLKATKWLRVALGANEQEPPPLIIKTGKTGKYGRWIATLYVPASSILGKRSGRPEVANLGDFSEAVTGTRLVNLNRLMVERGYAKAVDYD